MVFTDLPLSQEFKILGIDDYLWVQVLFNNEELFQEIGLVAVMFFSLNFYFLICCSQFPSMFSLLPYFSIVQLSSVCYPGHSRQGTSRKWSIQVTGNSLNNFRT